MNQDVSKSIVDEFYSLPPMFRTKSRLMGIIDDAIRNKTERLTPRSAWEKLKPGDIVISRRTGVKRAVLRANSMGSVTLSKIRGTGHTVYATCDRGMFILPSEVLRS